MIDDLIATKIATNVTCAGLLATYDFGSGATPAVFTCPVIPGDAKFPAIIINETGGPSDGNRCHGAWRGTYAVRIYDNKERSTEQTRHIVLAVTRVLHKATVFDANRNGMLICDQPSQISDPEGYYGYMVRVMAYEEDSLSA